MQQLPLTRIHGVSRRSLAACVLSLSVMAAGVQAAEAGSPSTGHHLLRTIDRSSDTTQTHAEGARSRAEDASTLRHRGGVSLQQVKTATVVEEQRTGIYGVVSGLESTFVNCRNVTNPQAGSHTVASGYSEKWACEWADVGYALDDEAIVVIGGMGTDSAFWGAVFGMARNTEVHCENLTRGLKSTLVLTIGLQWSCAVDISPGDQVRATIIGRSEPE